MPSSFQPPDDPTNLPCGDPDGHPPDRPPDHPLGHPPFADPGAMRPAAPIPGWIMAVGVIGIIYASLGILNNLCGGAWYVAAPAMVPWFAEMVGEPVDDETRARVKSASLVLALAYVPVALAALGLGVSLLVGSVRLVRGHPGARGPLMLWAVGRPIVALMATVAVLATLEQGMVITRAIDPTASDTEQLVGILWAGFILVASCVAPVAMLVLLFNERTRAAIDRLGALPSSD